MIDTATKMGVGRYFFSSSICVYRDMQPGEPELTEADTICRKVAEAQDGGTIEVWGDGSAIRSYTYVSDLVDGIYRLMHSDLEGPANIGCPQYVTVDELVATVAEVAGKEIHIRHVEGPVGVHSRNFSNARIYTTGWRAKVFLKEGIARTYPWIEEQVKAFES